MVSLVEVLWSPIFIYFQRFLHISGKVQVLRAELAKEIVVLNVKIKHILKILTHR